MQLTRPQLKVLSANIFHHFHGLDNPPAQEIYVPIEAMRDDPEEKDVIHATVRFIVEYCGRKVHSIRIKCKLDSTGRFLPKSWSYV